MTRTTVQSDVVVVGGGQAVLAIGYNLAQQDRDFTILEAANHPAAAWRARWDSLRLFTPARYDSLPGKPFPGDPDSYPSRDEVVGYLTGYAQEFDLPVDLSSPVSSVAPAGGRYLVVSSGLPWWTGAEQANRGGYRFAPDQYRLLSTFGDFVVFKGGLRNIAVEGRFDGNWRLPQGVQDALRATGVVSTR